MKVVNKQSVCLKVIFAVYLFKVVHKHLLHILSLTSNIAYGQGADAYRCNKLVKSMVRTDDNPLTDTRGWRTNHTLTIAYFSSIFKLFNLIFRLFVSTSLAQNWWIKRAAARQYQQNHLCAQRRLRSAWADLSLRCGTGHFVAFTEVQLVSSCNIVYFQCGRCSTNLPGTSGER